MVFCSYQGLFYLKINYRRSAQEFYAGRDPASWDDSDTAGEAQKPSNGQRQSESESLKSFWGNTWKNNPTWQLPGATVATVRRTLKWLRKI